MPRQARKQSSTGIYHIMLRGINRQQILEDEEDNKKFLEILKDYKKISGYKLYAYCLMGNHLHMIIKVEKEALEQIFKRICGRYAYWYNVKYRRAGHLFQDRFKSEPIEDECYFLSVLRYIHQNPLKAGLVDAIKDYVYSSYHCYIEPRKYQLVDVDFAMDMMNIKEFAEYQNKINVDKHLEIAEQILTPRLTDEQAKEIINRISECKNVSDYQRMEINVRNSYIGRLRKEGVSVRQISRLTGVSKGVVERCG